MGKSKGRGQKNASKKDPVAVKVAGVRKAKTKAVSTNLKRINFQNKAKTEAVDAAFSEMQGLITTKKTGVPGPRQQQKKADTQTSVKAKSESEEVMPDINVTAEEFSKLGS